MSDPKTDPKSTIASTLPDPGPPDYSPAMWKGERVYMTETHKVTLDTNHKYIEKPETPPCECEKDSPTVVQEAAKVLVAALIKAAASAAGIPPQLAAFSGLIAGPVSKAVDDFVSAQGGDIKKLLVQSGMTKDYAACQSFTLLVPKGSRIVSIDGFTDRLVGDEKLKKTTDGPTAKCAAGPEIAGLKVQYGPWSAWKYLETENVVTAVLMNWSHDENLDANLQVTFIPPERWAATHPRHHKNP